MPSRSWTLRFAVVRELISEHGQASGRLGVDRLLLPDIPPVDRQHRVRRVSAEAAAENHVVASAIANWLQPRVQPPVRLAVSPSSEGQSAAAHAPTRFTSSWDSLVQSARFADHRVSEPGASTGSNCIPNSLVQERPLQRPGMRLRAPVHAASRWMPTVAATLPCPSRPTRRRSRFDRPDVRSERADGSGRAPVRDERGRPGGRERAAPGHLQPAALSE